MRRCGTLLYALKVRVFRTLTVDPNLQEFQKKQQQAVKPIGHRRKIIRLADERRSKSD